MTTAMISYRAELWALVAEQRVGYRKTATMEGWSIAQTFTMPDGKASMVCHFETQDCRQELQALLDMLAQHGPEGQRERFRARRAEVSR